MVITVSVTLVIPVHIRLLMKVHCLADLTNRLGLSQLFVKLGNSLDPKFL